jgi:histidinol-phosphatase (PHP family)
VTIGDYHVHTRFSMDSHEEMEAQCRAAIERGIAEIAFTEHVDHDTCDDESRKHYRYDEYCAELERNRELFEGQLIILRAAEIDWNESIRAEVERFLTEHQFDFIIGSVHNLNHTYVGFTTLESMGGPRKMYDDYLDQVQGLVDSGFPNVIGHLDLPRRYHRVSMEEVDAEHFEQRVREIFRSAAKRGVGFEINTSGIRKGVGATHPEADVLAWFVEEGGDVLTVGSDSHRAEDTGHSITETYARLRELEIDWRTSFVEGKQKKVALPRG